MKKVQNEIIIEEHKKNHAEVNINEMKDTEEFYIKSIQVLTYFSVNHSLVNIQKYNLIYYTMIISLKKNCESDRLNYFLYQFQSNVVYFLEE